jgi:hypothetical protein
MTLPAPSRPTCPFLYKYSSHQHLERLKIIVLEHELYLPTLTELNDPMDGLPKLALQSEDEMVSFFRDRYARLHPNLTPAERRMEEAIIRYNVKHHTPAALQPKMVEALDAELQNYRIYSLTKRYDKVNLWALYAAQHHGYCLEFTNEGPLFERAWEVSYLEHSQMEILITDPAITNGYFLFCKTVDWATEEEVRLVLPRDKGSSVKFDPVWLTRLILGKDMSEDDRLTIRRWAAERKPALNIVEAYFDAVSRSIKLTG